MNITFNDNFGRKYTFLHVPKNAGKTISAYIQKHGLNVTTLHPQSHATCKEMKRLNKNLGITFAVFRNPYSRAVSTYKYLFETDLKSILAESEKYFRKPPNLDWWYEFREEFPEMTFETFAEKLPFMPLSIEQYHYRKVNKFLRFEHLDEDFKFIQDALPTKEPLFKINQTSSKKWEDYYTATSKQNVYKAYSQDFKFLGYQNI